MGPHVRKVINIRVDDYECCMWVHMAPATSVACGGPLIPKEIDIQLCNILDL